MRAADSGRWTQAAKADGSREGWAAGGEAPDVIWSSELKTPLRIAVPSVPQPRKVMLRSLEVPIAFIAGIGVLIRACKMRVSGGYVLSFTCKGSWAAFYDST